MNESGDCGEESFEMGLGGGSEGGLWQCQVCCCSAMQPRGRGASIMHAANGHANAAGGSGGPCMGANTHSGGAGTIWGAADEAFCSAVLEGDLHIVGKLYWGWAFVLSKQRLVKRKDVLQAKLVDVKIWSSC